MYVSLVHYLLHQLSVRLSLIHISAYPDRTFGNEADQQLKSLLSKAGKLQEKLTRDGIHAEVLREEPFTTARDSLDFQVFLMVWKKGWWNRRVEIRKL